MAKNILILGATGLIGHALYRKLLAEGHSVYATTRRQESELSADIPLFKPGSAATGFDATNIPQLEGLLHAWRPEVILNCLGITKRRNEINQPLEAIRVNALFPHQLNQLTSRLGIRMIHFSTDCVFDGASGPYREDSITTATDCYGRTKALGEVRIGPALTIRSSFIGREIFEKTELLEWFLGEQNVSGFSKVLYSGVSTIVLSQIIHDIILHQPGLEGLFQLAAPNPISKYDLLVHARKQFGWKGTLSREDSVTSTPTLDGSKLRKIINYEVPDWSEMMRDLAQENIPNTIVGSSQ